jgi:hypothetical protein
MSRKNEKNMQRDGKLITRVGREKKYQSKTENTMNSGKDDGD